MSYLFLRMEDMIALHAAILDTSGGSHGIRDKGGLESALNAAENRFFYEDASLSICAATYAYHLNMAHAFIDGNKRIAIAAAEAFVMLNGSVLDAADGELRDLMLAVAAGELSRSAVEAFFGQHINPD